MELYSDTYYIQRIQAGDTASFASLIDRYSGRVHSLILRIVRNKEDAEELAQDVFMKVFRHLDGFKGDCRFSTWIYRIAYNTAISATRKKKHLFLPVEEALIEQVSEEELGVLLSESGVEEPLERLTAALDRLPPEERALVLLFYMEDKSIEEITTITHLSASNVKTKLHRIRKKLVVFLKEMEEH